jgi:hypothetical protein
MKFTADRPFTDPDKAARCLMQHAHAFEPVQEGRIYIEKLNSHRQGHACEYSAGLALAIERGWLTMHESGSFTQFGADLFA